MLLEAAEGTAIDLPRSFMVGDRWRDVEAGRRAGCRTVFVDPRRTAEHERCPARRLLTVPDLADAADWILAEPATRDSTRMNR